MASAQRRFITPLSKPLPRTGRRLKRRAAAVVAIAALLAALFAPALTTRATPPALAAGVCPAISGYVYYDANNNGIMDPGETGLGNVPMDLRNAAGAQIATTTTAANGFYSFSVDTTVHSEDKTQTQTVTFPSAVTDWTITKPLPQFDPSLGTLTAVDVTNHASITSAIKAESLDSDPTTVTANVSGTVTLTLPGNRTVISAPVSEAGSFNAAAYDNVSDFAGPSGHDFGSKTATDSKTVTFTTGLADFSGTGTVPIVTAAAASSRTTGGGNVLNQINTTASSQVTVVYHYTPINCLPPGSYTIDETTQPPAYGDGQETSGNITPIPNTVGTDSIRITLANGDSLQNNFGEVLGSLHGCVYMDLNNNGLKESGEPPIPGTTITLIGTDVNGVSLTRILVTGSDGCYKFSGLFAGSYELRETQPPVCADGLDAIGSQGGITGNDRLYGIRLGAGVNGINNNFGELDCALSTTTPTTTTPTPFETVQGTRVTATPPGTPTPFETVAGDRVGPPTAGNSVAGVPLTPLNMMIGAVALLTLSAWLGIIAMGRRHAFAEVGEDDEDDDD